MLSISKTHENTLFRLTFIIFIFFLSFSITGFPSVASASPDHHHYYHRGIFHDARVANGHPLGKRGASGDRQGISSPLQLSQTYPQSSPFEAHPALVGFLVGIASVFIAGLMT